MQIVKWLCW